MDAAERVAEQLLREAGFTSICHEPNGYSTYPDFSIDGSVAVEVRRLDQHHLHEGKAEDLRQKAVPVLQRMATLCEELGQGDGHSWFISYRFARPVPPWKILIPKLEVVMRAFMVDPEKKACTLYEDAQFELDVFPASDRLETFFRLGMVSDRQSGGFVVAEFLANIRRCAIQKAEKKARCQVKYDASWLVLVNISGLKLAEYDKRQLLEHIERPSEWDRVIIARAMASADDWFEL